MAKKLNFLFTNKQWRLVLLKVFLFGLALLGVRYFNFSFPVLFVFFLLFLWFYLSQLPERRYFRISFLILIVTAFFVLRFLGYSFSLIFWETLFFSFLFYLLSGLTALTFRDRQSVYLFINTCLFLIIFLLFFSIGKSKYFLLSNVSFFLIIFLLLKEGFDFLRSLMPHSLFIIPNSQFMSLVIAFLSLELFWIIGLLPVGFINSALLLTLFVFFMRDFALAHFSGRLNRRFIFNHFIAFIILAVLIFTASKWSI